VRNDSVCLRGVSSARPLRARPSFRFSAAVGDRSPHELICTTRLKLEAVPFIAAPGTKIDFKLGRPACNGDRLARTGIAQGALDQQVAAFDEGERAKIDI
jgi:hypothetical protein